MYYPGKLVVIFSLNRIQLLRDCSKRDHFFSHPAMGNMCAQLPTSISDKDQKDGEIKNKVKIFCATNKVRASKQSEYTNVLQVVNAAAAW